MLSFEKIKFEELGMAAVLPLEEPSTRASIPVLLADSRPLYSRVSQILVRV